MHRYPQYPCQPAAHRAAVRRTTTRAKRVGFPDTSIHRMSSIPTVDAV